ncbi:MAG TPA: hypothetical protein VJN96_26805 [Vicinamibacterales bacterium]|nr:hypothetical protein [Vicinamibacterales bacterium]
MRSFVAGESAPRVFAGVGLLLVMLACYMAGADSLACRRNGDRVDCRVARSRLLGFVTVEQLVVTDVVDAWVRTSTTSQQTYRSGRGSNAQTTSSNDTLMLHTRDNRDVATLGGDQSSSYADQVVAIVKGATEPGRTDVNVKDELTSFEVQDSYVPIALVCGGLGAAFVVFGLVAMKSR